MQDILESKKCRICGSEDIYHRFTVTGIKIDKCRSCGFVQVRKKPTLEELEAMYGDHYFKHNKYTDSFPIRKEYERRLGLMEKVGIKPGAKVLDAGCAVGDFISFVGDRYEMWGNDISEFAIQKAKENNPKLADRFSAGLLEDQDFEPESFDAVVLWDVIEHLWDPAVVSGELLKYIKPGGYLFVSTPNIGAPIAKLSGKFWAFLTPPEHLCFFDKKTMKYLFDESHKTKVDKWFSRGKWVNFGFLLYKLKRIFPWMVPKFAIRMFQKGILGKFSLYIPTGDVQYVAIKK